MRIFDFGQEANGFFAVGQIATGVVAVGQIATGVIAVGQVARGVVAFGQLAVGLVGVGQLGIGFFYGAGMLGIGTFAGGLIPLPLIGLTAMRDLWRRRFRLRRSPIGVWRTVLLAAVAAGIWMGALLPLWDALFERGGIFYVPG